MSAPGNFASGEWVNTLFSPIRVGPSDALTSRCHGASHATAFANPRGHPR